MIFQFFFRAFVLSCNLNSNDHEICVRYEMKDRVAVLTIDNPPVNALGAGVWEAIDAGGRARRRRCRRPTPSC